MPGSMIHLITALEVNSNASSRFLAGNIAPDAVLTFELKETCHYRNSKTREQDIITLARSVDIEDHFMQGVILHLFLDYRWDIEVRDKFIENYKGDWVKVYRREIALASAYLFHNLSWSEYAFKRMISLDLSELCDINGASALEVKQYLESIFQWHKENKIGPSTIYSTEFIMEFAKKTANEYSQFLSLIN